MPQGVSRSREVSPGSYRSLPPRGLRHPRQEFGHAVYGFPHIVGQAVQVVAHDLFRSIAAVTNQCNLIALT